MRIIITGGGTGGHLFPALAVAEQFVDRFTDAEVLFVGAGRYIDTQALQGRGFAGRTIRCGGLKGGTILSRLTAILSLPIGFLQSLAIIRRFKPDLVFGVGGYVTGPVLAAAKIMGVPACIHEQNSVPGMANRQIGRFADRVFLSIPGSEGHFPRGKCTLTGNPVRREFLEMRAESDGKAEVDHDRPLTVLILGGSLGAHYLNCVLPGAMAVVKKGVSRPIKVVHQTGRDDVAMVEASYRQLGIDHTVKPFFNEMAALISQADLVVCRAGATTLAELTVLRKPAILVPYPHAADDHQAMNGEFLVRGGAAKMFRQEDIDETQLAREIIFLLTHPEKREEMSGNAGRLAKPEAAEFIVEQCVQLINRKDNGVGC